MLKAGQILRDERIKKGLTIDEVTLGTKIRKPFLLAIERGQYKDLPSSTYAHGFVRNYARFLGIHEEEILALFRREFSQKIDSKVFPEGLTKGKFLPSILGISRTGKVVILVFVVLLAYIAFQYRHAFINPPLTLYSPSEGEVIYSQIVTVHGRTDPDATVAVNNNSVSLDKDGTFKKTINVFLGKSTIIIKSVNKFGRQKIIERNIEARVGS